MVLGVDSQSQERLLRALAEQIKLPLLQIARQAELSQIKCDDEALRSIEYTADMAMRLIDSYLLSVQIQGQASLELEPVSVGVILQDTAHRLSRLAKDYNCTLEVHLTGRYEPVMANRHNLEAAYTMLGYSFIESIPPVAIKHQVTLGAHRSRRGVVAGIFGTQPGFSADAFRRGRAIFGTSRQGLPAVSSTSGAGIFLAESLLKSMETPLHQSRHRKCSGLAATLITSKQLKLI